MFHPSFTKFNLICTVFFASLEGFTCLTGGWGLRRRINSCPTESGDLESKAVVCVCVNGLGRLRQMEYLSISDMPPKKEKKRRLLCGQMQMCGQEPRGEGKSGKR